LGLEPDVVVPVLADALRDSDPFVRFCAAGALEGFAEQARPAMDTLMHSLDDPEKDVRFSVTNALHRIAPEVLPREDL
jgi:HEAT repeat protein